MVLWRPLTFGDEEQINHIKREENKAKLSSDSDFKDKLAEYRRVQSEIEELEQEAEEIYSELVGIGLNYGIQENEIYQYT